MEDKIAAILTGITLQSFEPSTGSAKIAIPGAAKLNEAQTEELRQTLLERLGEKTQLSGMNVGFDISKCNSTLSVSPAFPDETKSQAQWENAIAAIAQEAQKQSHPNISIEDLGCLTSGIGEFSSKKSRQIT